MPSISTSAAVSADKIEAAEVAAAVEYCQRTGQSPEGYEKSIQRFNNGLGMVVLLILPPKPRPWYEQPVLLQEGVDE
jgi:hypothetical protein